MDALKGLAQLDDDSVDCLITSPPFYGLQDYGLESLIWDGINNNSNGNEQCEHEWGDLKSCSQLLSVETERISLIEHTCENSAVPGIKVNDPTSCGFIEIRRESQSEENIPQSNGKNFTTSRKSNPSNFATFPEELVETPILAGCPEKICEKCGIPKRQVKKVRNSNDAFNIRVRDVKED